MAGRDGCPAMGSPREGGVPERHDAEHSCGVFVPIRADNYTARDAMPGL